MNVGRKLLPVDEDACDFAETRKQFFEDVVLAEALWQTSDNKNCTFNRQTSANGSSDATRV